MATFNAEQEKTSGKMSDLVMEYVSQFIAKDYLEAYEHAIKEERYEFVPSEFDESVYKKIAKLIRKNTKQNAKIFRGILYLAAALICAACLAFTVFVLANDTLRNGVFDSLYSITGGRNR